MYQCVLGRRYLYFADEKRRLLIHTQILTKNVIRSTCYHKAKIV